MDVEQQKGMIEQVHLVALFDCSKEISAASNRQKLARVIHGCLSSWIAQKVFIRLFSYQPSDGSFTSFLSYPVVSSPNLGLDTDQFSYVRYGSEVISLSQSTEPLLLDRTKETDFLFSSISDDQSVQQLWVIPLLHQSKRVGLLFVGLTPEVANSQQYLEWLQLLSTHIGLALSNILAREEASRRDQIKSLQLDIHRALDEEKNWEAKLKRIAQLTKTQIPFDFITFSFYHPVEKFMAISFLYHTEEEVETIYPETFIKRAGISREVLHQWLRARVQTAPQLLNGSDLQEACTQDPLKAAVVRTFDLASYLLLPLPLKDGGYFYIALYSHEAQTYQAHHLQLMQESASTFLLSFEKRLAHEEMERFAQEKDLLLRFNNHLLQIQDLDVLFRKLSEELGEFVPFHYISLRVWDRRRETVYWNIFSRHESNDLTEIKREVLTKGGSEYPKMVEEALNFQAEASIYQQDALGSKLKLFTLFREEFQASAILRLPLPISRNHRGHLILVAKHQNPFDRQHLDLLSLLAPQISLSIENQISLAELRLSEQRKRLEFNVIQALASIKDRKQLVLSLAQEINRVVPCDEFNIKIFDNASQLTKIGPTALKEEGRFRLLSEEEFIQASGLNEKSLQEAMEKMNALYSRVSNNVGEEYHKICQEYPLTQICRDLYEFRCAMYVPVYDQNRWMGTIILASRKPYAFSHQDLLTIQSLAANMPLAIENISALEELQSLKQQLEQEKTYLTEEIKINHNFEEIIGQAPALQSVFERIRLVAPLDTTVLVTGETGTGKELIARTIHSLSPRQAKTLIKVNCAALPSELIESELFGHEQGAFTGAIQRRLGKFELAHESTIFLDEIGELPKELQAKLLRAIQEKEIERIGGKETLRMNVRIIAATNRDLEKEVQENRFRLDLFYRLNVFPIQLPPLRKRKEDIPALAQYFLKKLNKKLGKKIRQIPDHIQKEMLAYHWPGNIRELEHIIEQSAIITQGDQLELATPLRNPAIHQAPDLSRDFSIKTLDEMQREHIVSTLRYTQGRVRGKDGAAELLNIKPSTLESRMKKLGIEKRYVLTQPNGSEGK